MSLSLLAGRTVSVHMHDSKSQPLYAHQQRFRQTYTSAQSDQLFVLFPLGIMENICLKLFLILVCNSERDIVWVFSYF